MDHKPGDAATVGALRLGVALEPSGLAAAEMIDLATTAESLGYDSIWSGEAYGFDAVTPLAWVAAHTSRIRVGTSIMQIPGRTPAMTAMTALAFAELSAGRFVLGLGLSGPVVAEGWHGVAAGAPLRRTREYLDLVRQILAGESPVSLDGTCYQVPYRGEGATGFGVALRPMSRPIHDVPIYLAAIGPKNVRLGVREADGVLPILWSPTHWQEVYGSELFEGRSGSVEVAPRVWISIGDDLEVCRREVRKHIAFYIGAMGPIGKNYYADLVRSYGYEEVVDRVEQCYLERRRDDAHDCVTDELVDELALAGPPGHVAEQLEKWRGGPVGTMIVDAHDRDTLEILAELVG